MHQNISYYTVIVVVVIVYATFLIPQSKARELRPSDHGLYYEEDSSLPPAQTDAATTEMRSFFGKTNTSSVVPLPEAKDIGDTWWNIHKDGKSRDTTTKMDHVRFGLMVASLICGMIGIVLLVVSGVVFLFRLQKRKSTGADGGGKMERLAATSSGSGSDAVHHAVSSDKI